MTFPLLPQPPKDYDSGYFNQLLRALSTYFKSRDAVQPVRATFLNVFIDTLPTEAQVGTLRVGDIYRDSTAGNVLKVKV